MNLSLFALIPLLTKEGREKVSARIRWSCTALALVLLFVPPVVSLCVMPAPGETAASDADSVNVLIAQPNINPYDKFGGMFFTEVDVLPSLGEELYASLSGMDGRGRAVAKVSVEPLVNWLWIGGTLMSLMPLLALRRRKTKAEAQ